MFAICHGMLRVIPFWAIPFALVCQPAYGLEVESYYGKYDVKQKDIRGASKSLDGPHAETWPSAPKPKRAYKIGVLFPHLKDPYWLAVNYGIIERAKETGVTIKLLEAGGYRRLGDQRRQLTSDLIKDKVDGIILAAISYDKFDKPVEEVNGKGIPVVEVINDIRASSIRAKRLSPSSTWGTRRGSTCGRIQREKTSRLLSSPAPKDRDGRRTPCSDFSRHLREAREQRAS
ncbi:MAG: substrate-binding domain-containing protein [Planctomycetota bacterium]|jgi:protein TorT|nr:substrate-binding domain-containing protein [Planctomycetota bacterium]MDP7251683.1 substrate-binding domain-containing protein [Planctomycetota bacterium]